MTETNVAELASATDEGRKPRIALMGEFSSGKSTLSNLLVGSRPLPEKVTATQLPPVWIAYGDQAPYREDLDGNIFPIDIEKIEEVSLEETRVIRIFLKSDILELCDLVDMPGISDPNMPPEVWQRMIEMADGVIWCTHATQAWRQSEAAVWQTLSKDIYQNSILLVTRIDKILTERDRLRVIARVAKETKGMFAGLYPVALLEAMEAGEDRAKWRASGVLNFVDKLLEVVGGISETTGSDFALSDEAQEAPETDDENETSEEFVANADTQVDVAVHDDNAGRIMPSRVRPTARPTERTTERPGPADGSVVLDFQQGASKAGPADGSGDLRQSFVES
jgi:GTPase SAR1 family protein